MTARRSGTAADRARPLSFTRRLALLACVATGFSVAELGWIWSVSRPALLILVWTVLPTLVPPLGLAGAGWLLGRSKRPRLRGLGHRLTTLAMPAGWALLPAAAATAALPSLPDPLLDLATLIASCVALAVLASRWPRLCLAYPLLALALLPLRVERSPPLAAPPGARATGPDLVLITLDTLRADHVGAIGGYDRDVATPNLDALGASGAIFTQGVAEVPLTFPSHASMLTGRHSHESGATRNGQGLGDEVRTVAQELRDAGFETAAFVSSGIIRGSTGLGQGFVHYDDCMSHWSMALRATLPAALARTDLVRGRSFTRPGDRTLARALRWLEDADQPFFLWVHLYDPHAPYRPPPQFELLYDPNEPGIPGAPGENRRRASHLHPMLFDFLPRDLRPAIARYAGEVTWTDQLVGQLLQDIPESANVVLAADHGESLTEHGYLLNHGADLHEPSLAVPIMVRAPSVVQAGQVTDRPTSLQRIGPTLLDLAGLEPGAPTLLDQLQAQDSPPTPIVSYAPGQQARQSFDLRRTSKVALRLGTLKWIVDEHGEVEHYDLAMDPDELVDLAQDHPDTERMLAWGQQMLVTIEEAQDQVVSNADAETAEMLRQLGYVE